MPISCKASVAIHNIITNEDQSLNKKIKLELYKIKKNAFLTPFINKVQSLLLVKNCTPSHLEPKSPSAGASLCLVHYTHSSIACLSECPGCRTLCPSCLECIGKRDFKTNAFESLAFCALARQPLPGYMYRYNNALFFP